eukprot:TRINITY_DN8014_c0_g1_i1.p2 TRINITY_DN8014_c0_g1~~TRINITY_DN8014_c0_g1_i1.p2  ORF type:complete len:94 (+),score=7.26 TRINITY_DN8014_c0_g1_i1:30-284(+)
MTNTEDTGLSTVDYIVYVVIGLAGFFLLTLSLTCCFCRHKIQCCKRCRVQRSRTGRATQKRVARWLEMHEQTDTFVQTECDTCW